MINIKDLRNCLSRLLRLPDKNITIKRKKKMITEKAPNGGAKLKRRSVIKIEIIE